jgi:hypothetical protein
VVITPVPILIAQLLTGLEIRSENRACPQKVTMDFQRSPTCIMTILQGKQFEVFTAVAMTNTASWMWHRRALVKTDVSEAIIASIIRVTRIVKLGTT